MKQISQLTKTIQDIATDTDNKLSDLEKQNERDYANLINSYRIKFPKSPVIMGFVRWKNIVKF